MIKKLNKIKHEYSLLLNNIPSMVVCLFVLSVVLMNLLANKELVSTTYVALDCGFTLSWISFLCMDVICKRYGPKASTMISILAIAINLAVCIIFNLLSMTPGNWGEYYTYLDYPEMSNAVNTSLNNTIAGTWYVLLGSSIAMLISSIVNSGINWVIGKSLKNKVSYKSFAIRSFVSTGIAQFVDNFIFATLVSKIFFGWTWTQIFICSLIGAVLELLCEIVFSPLGYKISKKWEEEQVGQKFIDHVNQGA